MKLNKNSNSKIQSNEIVDSTQNSKKYEKFHNTNWFLILLIIFIPIVGFVLVVRKKNFSKLKKIIIALLCLLSFIISMIIFLPKNNNISTPNSQSSSQNETVPIPNTNEMVDYIIRKGKEDAKNATDEQLATAIDYIRGNIINLHKDNDTMEKIMYYGSLLEYHYDGKSESSAILKNIGIDAVQAVKYVYRGAETVDSDHTQANIEQITKGFKKFREYFNSKK